MAGILGMLGLQAAGEVVNTGLGMVSGRANAEKEYELNKQMFDYTYNKTNTTAQMEQLKKNGLNPTLMYSGGGSQQLQTSSNGANVSMVKGNIDPMMAAQMTLIESQKDNIDADTRLKEVEAHKREGVDTDLAMAEIENKDVQTRLFGVTVDQITNQSKADLIVKEATSKMFHAMELNQLKSTEKMDSEMKKNYEEIVKMRAEMIFLEDQIKVAEMNANANLRNAASQEKDVKTRQFEAATGRLEYMMKQKGMYYYYGIDENPLTKSIIDTNAAAAYNNYVGGTAKAIDAVGNTVGTIGSMAAPGPKAVKGFGR